MQYIVDVVIVVIAIIVISKSAQKGFTASLLDTFSILLAGFATYKFTKPLADFFYNLFVKDLVMTNFKNTLDKMSGNLSLQNKINELINSLPEFAVNFAKGIGVDVNALQASISQSAASTDAALIETVTNNIAYNVMIVATQVVTALILFVIASILISLIAKLFTETIKKIPVIGSADTLLGGAFGLVKAIIIVGVFVTVAYMFVSAADVDSPLKIVEQSKIYTFLIQYNPIVKLINS